MGPPVDLVQWIGAISGILGLLGAAAGFGAMRQRLLRVETDVERLAGEVKDLQEMRVKVAIVEERTGTLLKATEVMGGKLDTALAHLLDEGRSFARQVVREARAGGTA